MTLIDVVSITGISIILPPTANAQSVTTTLNTAASVTLTGSDPNTPALPLTYTATTAPSHGALSGTAPNLTYTPTTGYTGSDSFQFNVSNGTLSSSVATVSITVNSTLAPAFVNGSFEAPSLGTASQQYNPVGATWTFLGDSGIQSNGSGWGVPNAPDGTQTAFLNGNPNRGTGNLGNISQSVNFTTTGTYVVNFQGARRQGQVQPLMLTVDGVQVGGLLTPSGSTFGLVTSGVFTINTTGLHTITLSATATTSDLTTMVDQMALNAQ